MSEFHEVRLGDVAQKIGSGATPRGGSTVYRDQGIALIRSQNVLNNSMTVEGVARISDEAARSLSGVTVVARDVLINITGDSVARASMVDPLLLPARVNQHVAIIRTSKRLVPEFLQKYLVSPIGNSRLMALATAGGTRNALTKSHLANLLVPLPPLREQQAIADVLGALDDKIAANTRLAATTDAYLSALLESFISDATPSTHLKTIADVNASTIKPQTVGELRYVDIASVGVGSFTYPERSAWADAPGRARRKLRKGDTIWSTVRPNRRSHALNLSDDPLLVASTGLAVLSPTTVSASYLYEVTRRPEFTSYLENVAEGSAYPAVRAERFGDATVPLLSPENRSAFESVATPLRESSHFLAEENRALAATRDALLPKLMSSALRVKDAVGVAEQAGA